ncbi:MAG TPA: hypothetical protein VFS18_05660 [Actinomycetota bacterium]|nr:hypothetical protein [Actinomycetota bacterium]
MSTVSAILIEELRSAGLLMGIEPHLTSKGREWLRQLEETETKDVAEDWATDFILSTNAISR